MKKKKELTNIEILGAKEHNLKNLNIKIPKKQLVVITGVSGSGKSSLVFDTIFAEGQRRYVESLSSYARQFLGQMEKPKYDSIKGLSPTIAIEQKSASKNPRSTVGTITEVYDYLRVFFARLGIQHCYKCGKKVGSGSIDSIVKNVLEENLNQKIIILAPLVNNRKGEYKDLFKKLIQEGFSRVRVNGVMSLIEEVPSLEKHKKHSIELVIDRLTLTKQNKKRLTDSLEMGLKKGSQEVQVFSNGEIKKYSTERSCCGISYPELEPNMFSFNSPKGMCSSCNGIGSSITINPEKIVEDEDLSISQGAVRPWKGFFENGEQKWFNWGDSRYFQAIQKKWKIDFKKPWRELPNRHKDLIFYGDNKNKILGKFFLGVEGSLIKYFKNKEAKNDGKKNYVEKYLIYKTCKSCQGTRLNEFARNVFVKEMSISKFSDMSIDQELDFILGLNFKGSNKIISEELIKEISARLKFLISVGLDYLSLSRAGNTLSGGEAQRIRLASQIGSELTGVLYILDEPSIGLHQKDNEKLINMLKHLRDIGNSVLVVEHDEETMNQADYLIDIGPGAGKFGGEIIAKGTPSQVKKNKKSSTGKYLSKKNKIERKSALRKTESFIEIKGATENNLKNINVKIPLKVLTVVSGVSGAGKSTLINQILFPAISNKLHKTNLTTGKHKEIIGLDKINKIINIDQKPIGKTPRSNPATYTKLFDHIRDLFEKLPESKARGYKKGRYSFNVKGGRCEKCQGGGSISVEMHFLPDVMVICDECQGKRFNEATLEVKFKGLSIADVLELSVDDALNYFKNQPKILKILKTLKEVGLGYISLGQSAITLSGGEAQRIKLSRELAKRDTGDTFYILDEPTTGLHFEDIQNLINVLDSLVSKGNSVLVIEHNLDVIKNSDYIIDIGPNGGRAGGEVVAEGTPKEVSRVKKSYTGKYLK